MKKLIGTTTAFAVALWASAALAGVYVSGPLPSEFSGGTIGPNPDVFKAMGKGYSNGLKLSAGASKCYSKGASNIAKGKPSGVDTCINNSKKGIIPKYIAKDAKILPKAPCQLGASTAGPLVVGLVKSFNPQIYCQSPSGAFLDTAAF